MPQCEEVPVRGVPCAGRCGARQPSGCWIIHRALAGITCPVNGGDTGTCHPCAEQKQDRRWSHPGCPPCQPSRRGCSLLSENSSASGVWLPALSSADSVLLIVNTLHETALELPSGHSGLPSALSPSIPAASQHQASSSPSSREVISTLCLKIISGINEKYKTGNISF